jgi:saccharopine dehydrogenase-like NADP-dependent oxidoreductase
MEEVVVIGAGKIGATIAGLLASTDDYQITPADRSTEVLDRLDQKERIRIAVADVEDSSKLVICCTQRCPLPSDDDYCGSGPSCPNALSRLD